jgi:tripartite-type tricarboxylate transporter receptor subunit TctC
MKKLIASLALALVSSLSQAQTVINVVWPFSISSADANMVRGLIDQANTQQNRYKFVFLSKQGAGGTIAASWVLENADNHVLISSSSFYVRPMLYKESHDASQFAMIGTVCNGKPLAVFSRKYATLKEVGNREITMGINNGSITQLVSRGISAGSSIKVAEISYKGTPEATTDVLGGHLDSSVDYVGPVTFARFPSNTKVHVLGITGTVSHPGMPTFKSQGIDGLEILTNNYNIFVSKALPATQQQELNTIFNNAFNDVVRENCENDFGKVVKSNLAQASRLHQDNIAAWRRITQNMPKE